MQGKNDMNYSLSQSEALRLIDLLKRCMDLALYIPSRGKRLDYEVVDIDTNNEMFIASINRRNKFDDKCSFILRYRKTNTILLRLDVGCTAKHTNPDDTVIKGAHLHRYQAGYDEKFAMPVNLNSKTLIDDLRFFLNEANIEEPQKIVSILSMED